MKPSYLIHCRGCGTTFHGTETRRHFRICRAGSEQQFMATREQVLAYEANALAESVEAERISAQARIRSPRIRHNQGRAPKCG